MLSKSVQLLNRTYQTFSLNIDRSVQSENNNDPQQLSSNDQSNDVPLDEEDERVLAATNTVRKVKKNYY